MDESDKLGLTTLKRLLEPELEEPSEPVHSQLQRGNNYAFVGQSQRKTDPRTFECKRAEFAIFRPVVKNAQPRHSLNTDLSLARARSA